MRKLEVKKDIDPRTNRPRIPTLDQSLAEHFKRIHAKSPGAPGIPFRYARPVFRTPGWKK